MYFWKEREDKTADPWFITTSSQEVALLLVKYMNGDTEKRHFDKLHIYKTRTEQSSECLHKPMSGREAQENRINDHVALNYTHPDSCI